MMLNSSETFLTWSLEFLRDRWLDALDHTRHLQFHGARLSANHWRDTPAHDARSPIDRIAATGILVHQALEQILAEHVGLTTTQAYRNVRARDIVNCLRNLMEESNTSGSPWCLCRIFPP